MSDATVSLQRATLSSGDTIVFNEGITVLVGPNNVGKTRLLQELGAATPHHPNHSIVKSTKVALHGSVDDAIAWFDRDYAPPRLEQPSGRDPSDSVYVLPSGERIHKTQLQKRWVNGSASSLGQELLLDLSVEGRLELTYVADAVEGTWNGSLLPLQRLWLSPAREKAVCDAVYGILREPITIHRAAGDNISVHMGRPETNHWEDPITYAWEMKGLPEVRKEGHGKRAIVGMLMAIGAGAYPVVLIDEPELFLHPPYARAFGRVLNDVRARGTQVILATHSVDILQGLVSSLREPDKLSIARMTRHRDVNRIAMIDSSTIGGMVQDPLMRHSSIIHRRPLLPRCRVD